MVSAKAKKLGFAALVAGLISGAGAFFATKNYTGRDSLRDPPSLTAQDSDAGEDGDAEPPTPELTDGGTSSTRTSTKTTELTAKLNIVRKELDTQALVITQVKAEIKTDIVNINAEISNGNGVTKEDFNALFKPHEQHLADALTTARRVLALLEKYEKKDPYNKDLLILKSKAATTLKNANAELVGIARFRKDLKFN